MKSIPFAIYRANKSSNGSAMQVDFNVDKQAVFLECANQKTEDRFDWGNKITVKLSITDISKFLEVLENVSPAIKLFHQPSKGEYKVAQTVRNAVIDFSGNQYGYSIRVSQQTVDGLKAVSLNVSKSEAIVLRVLFHKAIVSMYGW